MNDPNHPHRLSNKIFSFVMRVGHNLSRKFRSVFKFINRSRKILIMQIYGVFHSHTSKGYNKFIVYTILEPRERARYYPVYFPAIYRTLLSSFVRI